MKKRMFIALDIADPDKAKLGHWRDQHLSLAFKTISEKKPSYYLGVSWSNRRLTTSPFDAID